MGFFNWVMNGLGFETTEKEKKQKKDKKFKQQEPEDKYADFNLHEKVAGATPAPSQPNNNAFAGLGFQTESNIIMLEPKTHKEIQQVVDYLKQGQSVAVNLEGIASEDSMRILDFLSGAIYGINGSIHRWHGDLFLLAPEGHKILKKQ